jgi:hypothetical protein
MPADEKAFEKVLSLHLGATRGAEIAIDSAGHGGGSDGPCRLHSRACIGDG